MKLDPAYIRSRLLQLATVSSPSSLPAASPPLLQAAVLVLLCPGATEPVTILTQRSVDVPQHAGQISFPGGRVHADDMSLEATALRETTEEIGLDSSQVAILGRLPLTQVASSGFTITPIVAWAETRPRFQPDPREVAALIDCPLALALDPSAYRTDTLTHEGKVREFWYIDIAGHHVWGATARILRSLALLLAAEAQVRIQADRC